jgi:hypothetical protein
LGERVDVFTGIAVFIRGFGKGRRTLYQQVVILIEEEELLVGLADVEDRYDRNCTDDFGF